MEDYKKKYEEVFNRAKGAHRSAKSDKENGVTDKITEYTIQLTETIFPELKESEEEKIRKWLIGVIKSNEYGSISNVGEMPCPKPNVIAWLEKQGKLIEEYEDKLDRMSCESFDKGYKAALEKQNEPQVRTGSEWVRTIDDACDKRYAEEYAHGEYCHQQSFRWGFQEGVDWLEKQGEQKPIFPKFKVGDTIKCKHDDRQFTIKSVDLDKGTYTYTQEGCGNDIDYADKEFELVEQNPAWSEEDERLCQCLIKDQEEALDEVRNDKYGHSEIISDLKGMYRERIDWLKSLKERYSWKPSKEEIEAFEHFVRSVGESGYASPYDSNTKLLYSLLQQLKKLREE